MATGSAWISRPALRLAATTLTNAAATSPMATFVAREARFEGEALREVLGEFTLRGIRQPLTLTALRWNCRINLLFLREVCGGDFEAQIDRSDFGITHSALFVADRVRLLIQVEGIRQGAAFVRTPTSPPRRRGAASAAAPAPHRRARRSSAGHCRSACGRPASPVMR